MTTNQPNLRAAMNNQRETLSAMISRDMRKLSRQCVDLMGDRKGLEALLTRALKEIGSCKHLYVLDNNMVQIVSNITKTAPDEKSFGRDRSKRPYMQGIVGTSNFLLSEAYISKNSKRPSLTAVRVIRDRDNARLGFLGADFDLRELPGTRDIYVEGTQWQQMKGDPSIRSNLFHQQRQESSIDRHIGEVLPAITELITHRGVFHAKLHFSSSRAVLWMTENPFTYRLVSPQELIDPAICMAYPQTDYPANAIVPQEMITPIFEMFSQLRFADENIYLRAGSLNVCNGMVGLNFSCDGSHYIRYDEFLQNGLEFWFGAAGV